MQELQDGLKGKLLTFQDELCCLSRNIFGSMPRNKVGTETFCDMTAGEKRCGFLVDSGFIYNYTSLMAVMLKKMFNEHKFF